MKRLLVLAAILLVGKAHGWNDGKDDLEAALKTVEHRGERLLALLLNKIKTRRDKTGDVGEVETHKFAIDTRDQQVYCTRRGEVDQEHMLQMCSICHYFKMLPDDYFPSYLNEVRCDTDTRCLSGYGQCKQRTQSFTVMQQIGGNWQPMTVSVDVGCECGVLSGNALHGLISN
ncbi:uncharacterized protein T16H12.9-like [Branchiostoma floridae x Branchiostoma japonicum]